MFRELGSCVGRGDPMVARTVRYWFICNMAASRSVWMFCRHWSLASRCCRSWPSMARSSSSVNPANPAGGTGMGGKPNRGGNDIPIHGGGKGKPGTAPTGAVSDPDAESPPGLEVLAVV